MAPYHYCAAKMVLTFIINKSYDFKLRIVTTGCGIKLIVYFLCCTYENSRGFDIISVYRYRKTITKALLISTTMYNFAKP